MTSSRIKAAGHYLPKDVIDNRTLIDRFNLDVDEAWIESRTGIKTRHWMPPGQTTSDMAVEAAKQTLEHAQVEPTELDRVILATITPDRPSPATAVDITARLGATCAAFDVSAACAGFIYAVDIARGAIATGSKNVLVLTADARSRFVDTSDRRGTVLFADGAAGVLVTSASDEAESRILSIDVGSEGGRGFGAYVPAGGTARPASAKTVANGEHFVHVDGFTEILDRFTGYTTGSVNRALAKAGWSARDIDLFITHQGNAYLVDSVVAAAGVDPAKAINNVYRHGNTSGASIGIALSEAIEEGRAGSGSRVVMTAAGAGWAYGALTFVL